ncbi:MAG: hypothetical protein ACRCVI_01405 [Mycoplasmoidaceae bacterium]
MSDKKEKVVTKKKQVKPSKTLANLFGKKDKSKKAKTPPKKTTPLATIKPDLDDDLLELQDNDLAINNDIFFEKFEKSKKDFKKENKKRKLFAQKLMSSQSKIQGLQRKLEDNSFLFKVYIFLFTSFFVTVGFSIGVFTVLLPYANHQVYDANNVSDIWQRVSYVQYPHFAMTTVVFSGIIFCLLPMPYLYLIATWFVGINDVKRSKMFVLTNFYLAVFALTLFIVTFILSTIFFAGIGAPSIQFPAVPLP